MVHINNTFKLFSTREIQTLPQVGQGNLRLLIESIVDSFAISAHHKSLELFIRYNEVSPEQVMMNHSLMRKAITGLIGNAVHHTSTGFILICVSTKVTNKQSVEYQIDLMDTGVAIETEKFERIVEHGFQRNLPLQDYGSSHETLLNCHKSICAMGGRISFETKPSEHNISTFRIGLEQVFDMKTSNGLHNMMKGKRVLIIDESPVSRRLLCEQLSEWGIHSKATATYQNGYRYLKEAFYLGNEFDILISNCPAFGSVAKKQFAIMRQSPVLRNIKTIIMLQQPVVQQSPHVQSLQPSAVLMKPIKRPALFSALIETLSQHTTPTPEQFPAELPLLQGIKAIHPAPPPI